MICSLKSESAIIFCNHRDAAERISDTLNEKGIYATYYHGGMDQDERERALIQFRNGSISLFNHNRFGSTWIGYSGNETRNSLSFAIKRR